MKSLKLNSLESRNLSKRELSFAIGGRQCTCSCYYANNNGSSIEDNGNANFDLGPNGGDSEKGYPQVIIGDGTAK